MRKRTRRTYRNEESDETSGDDDSSCPTRDTASQDPEMRDASIGVKKNVETAVDATVQRATSSATTGERDVNADNQTISYDSGSNRERLSTRYGLEFTKRGQAAKVQRLENEFGQERVSRWVEKGMTVEAMGKPRDMQAFRERQKQRPETVPADIERQNEASVQRNVARTRDDGVPGNTDVPDSVRDVLSSPGQSLDKTIQRTMEGRMGDSFSDVRVHAGPQAAAACEDINARAFTVGNHIAFNRGEYDPESRDGQHVIAHELAHVRQQRGDVSMLPQEELALEVDPDPKLEQEAEETAYEVMRGSEPAVQRMAKTGIHIQRHLDQPRDEKGRFDYKEKEEYPDKKYNIDNRPSYASGQVEEVWEAAKQKSPDGKVRDPNKPWIVLEWDRSKSRGDQWHMGHREDREYRYLLEYYLRGIISEKEFIEEYQNPEHYQPEAPKENMSGNHEGDGEYWQEKFGLLEENGE